MIILKAGSHICQGTGRASDADNEGMRGYDGGGGSAGSWDGGGGRYWDGGYASAGSSVKLGLGGLSGGRQVLAPFGGPRLRVESFEVPASIALERDEIGKRKQREAYGIEAKIPVVGLIPSRADQHRRRALTRGGSIEWDVPGGSKREVVTDCYPLSHSSLFTLCLLHEVHQVHGEPRGDLSSAIKDEALKYARVYDGH
ncbi:hypothetical protein R3P38DRAFT_2806495 [Favolaschia claudopus]|uniref:Uncharacterized protein n=1 Tax=Favolaschia claudopus TaxID=2862362 RepID=A0AAV9ZJW5_9AGAR